MLGSNDPLCSSIMPNFELVAFAGSDMTISLDRERDWRAFGLAEWVQSGGGEAVGLLDDEGDGGSWEGEAEVMGNKGADGADTELLNREFAKQREGTEHQQLMEGQMSTHHMETHCPGRERSIDMWSADLCRSIGLSFCMAVEETYFQIERDLQL